MSDQVIKSSVFQPRARGSSTNLTAHVKKVDLNKEILFTVQAECDNTNIFSNNTTLPVQIATGKVCLNGYLSIINCLRAHSCQ